MVGWPLKMTADPKFLLVFHVIYNSKTTESVRISYLQNCLSYKVGWALKMITDLNFLIEFPIIYTHKTTGSAPFLAKMTKKVQNAQIQYATQKKSSNLCVLISILKL